MPATQIKAQSKAVFTSPDSFATTMVMLLVDTYGTECFDWAPDTLKMEIEDDFHLKIPRPNFDRLLAGINMILSDDFYRSLPDFINYCNILSGDTYDPRTWDPADSAECAWGITEGLLLSPPEDDDENPFDVEIVAYIGEVLNQEGIITPPDVLKIAVRSQDPASFVAGNFSDDPEMFNAVYDLETSKTDEINAAVKGSLQALAQQLEQVPLRSGSAKNVVMQMVQSLGRPKQAATIELESYGKELRAINL